MSLSKEKEVTVTAAEPVQKATAGAVMEHTEMAVP
jgi:predicted ATPase